MDTAASPMDKTPVDKTPASTVRVAATVTSVHAIGAALVCPVGALEHVTDGLVRYARNGDVHLAHRAFGESGPVLVTRAVFATVDWLQFWELTK